VIKDNIKNAQNYYNISKRIEIGLKYLIDTDFTILKNAKYEIAGDEIFAIVQDYFSKPVTEGFFEAHKKYIDIQYIIKGEEDIGVSKIENFSEITDYDENKDIVFLKPNNHIKLEFINLKEKEFMILNPVDAHKPSISKKISSYVKKVVVKVLI
jgi:YhcH/YjgK/YiaL family protein